MVFFVELRNFVFQHIDFYFLLPDKLGILFQIILIILKNSFQSHNFVHLFVVPFLQFHFGVFYHLQGFFVLFVFSDEPVVSFEKYDLIYRGYIIFAYHHQFLIRNHQVMQILLKSFNFGVFSCDFSVEGLYFFLLGSILFLKFIHDGHQPLVFSNHFIHLILETLVLITQFCVLLVHEFCNRLDLFNVAVFWRIFLISAFFTYLIHFQHQVVDFLSLPLLNNFLLSVSTCVNLVL